MMKKITNPKFKKKYIILIILLGIYLIMRLFFLFSTNLFNEEECRVGTITKELIMDPNLPVFDYTAFFSIYYPGRLFEALLTIPFYLIFGESGISVKLMFLTVSAGIVCLVYLFLDKFFTKKTAIMATILMTFSIPVYTLMTLSQGGPHIESTFFEILIMLFFYNAFFDKKQNIKSFIFLGLAGGFAIFVNPISLIMLSACILFWFIFDKTFFLKKNFFVFFVFFLIGLSPFIYYNLTCDLTSPEFDHGGQPLISKVFGDELNTNKVIGIITKLKNLIIYDLPKSFMFKDFIFFNRNLLSYLYFFLFICSFIFLSYHYRKSIIKPLKRFNIKPEKIKKEIFILFYPIIFVIIYSISSFSVDHGRFGAVGYRYLLTFYVFMFIIISLFLTKLYYYKKTTFISVFLIIILILSGIIGNISFVSFRDIGEGVVYRPYCYDQLGENNGYKQCNKLDEKYKSFCFKGDAMFIKYSDSDSIKELERYCNKVSKNYKCFCYNGIGQAIYRRLENNSSKFISQLNKIDKEYIPCFYIGVGWVNGDFWAQNYENVHFEDKIETIYKPYYFEGLGQGIGQFIGVIPTQAIRQCNEVEHIYRAYCFKGLAWSIAGKFGDNPTKAGKICKKVDEEYQNYCYEGIGSYIGLMMMYNLTMANRECDKLGNNSISCIQGLNKYINEIKLFDNINNNTKIIE